MSRRRTGHGPDDWQDEGPRSPNPAAVTWSLGAYQAPSPSARARGRDVESGELRDYQPRENA